MSLYDEWTDTHAAVQFNDNGPFYLHNEAAPDLSSSYQEEELHVNPNMWNERWHVTQVLHGADNEERGEKKAERFSSFVKKMCS